MKIMLAAPIDYRIADGESHAFFNNQPWADVTIAAADRFLVTLGFSTAIRRYCSPK